MKIHPAQFKRYKANLEKLYNAASPDTMERGREWYRNAHNICKGFAEKYGVPFSHVCMVMAILSPAISWHNNIKSCENMLEAYQMGAQSTDEFKVTTYNSNKKLAWEVLNERKHFILTRTNMKTYSFFWNMWAVYDDSRVTIDRHAIKAMEGSTKAGSRDVSAPLYRKAQHVYSIIAKEKGLKPHEFQAIIWTQYKQEVNR
jgi:hypothetical protein